MMEIITCPLGENIKSFLQQKGYRNFDCGGRGICGKCKAKIIEGNAGELTEEEKNKLTKEEIVENIRLLCQIRAVTEIKFSLKIEIKQIEAIEKIKENAKQIDTSNENSNKSNDRICNRACKRFGVAFDIGTTTVTGRLFDLDKKQAIEEKTIWNLQGCFGSDIITRMQYCLEQPNGSNEMQEKIACCLDEILEFFQKKRENIEDREIEISNIVIAGNSAMTHFLLGEKVDSLAKTPYKPLFTKGQNRMGSECGLRNAGNATLFTLPLLQGQVGGDITAALLSIDIFSKADNTILIDIGTNGEIALFRNGIIYICSTAAGPALEGAGISYGMRAELGAVERVWLTNGEVYTKVIGNVKAQGICGSALIDAIAVLLDLGKLHKNGYLDSGSFSLINHTNSYDSYKNNFNVKFDSSFDIKIVQEDIRQYQMVKAAIRAGLEMLVCAAGTKIEEINHIYIAGSFGSNIQKRNAIRTGLLPKVSPEKITIIGNASLQGASLVLLSEEAKQYAEKIRKAAVLINLAEKREFQEMYIKYMDF